jgi:hypothetical protein
LWKYALTPVRPVYTVSATAGAAVTTMDARITGASARSMCAPLLLGRAIGTTIARVHFNGH